MHDPELTAAFVKSIRKYFEDHELKAYDKEAGGSRKYNKKYFDGMQKEFAPDSKLYGKQTEEKKNGKAK